MALAIRSFRTSTAIPAQPGDSGEKDSPVDDLVSCHSHELLAHARWLTRSEADAWDLFQETALRALNNHRRIPSHMSRAWLMRTMFNLFIDDCRARRVRKRHRILSLRFDADPVVPEPESPPIWDQVATGALERAVRALPPRSCGLFTLYAAGVPYSEIAKLYCTSIKTIGTRLHRLRRALRRALVKDLPAPAESPTE